MVSSKHIAVTIESNGNTLTEYPCTSPAIEQDNFHERYVEAVAGAPFSIIVGCDGGILSTSNTVGGMCYAVNFDGGKASWFSAHAVPHCRIFGKKKFYQNGDKVKRGFLFAETETGTLMHSECSESMMR